MPLPRDSNGFIKTFTSNQELEIINFFDKYGVVVIENVLNEKEIQDSIDAIWDHQELVSRGVSRYDPQTWHHSWPMDGKIERKGWINSYDDVLCPRSWKNRFNPTLVKVFEMLWTHIKGSKQDLRVNFDRYGVMRPILDPKWKTDDGWLHTDQNPRTEKDFVRLQGILTFTESKEDSGGGFLCIPGFQHQWTEYCQEDHPDEHVCPFTSKSDPIEEKICVKPGSLIIWDSRLPHANFPNESKTQFRFVQYITYYPSYLESSKKTRIRSEDAVFIKEQMKREGLEFGDQEYRYIGGIKST